MNSLSAPSAQWWQQPIGGCVGDMFDVHVGPVVPHRDVESGPNRDPTCTRGQSRSVANSMWRLRGEAASPVGCLARHSLWSSGGPRAPTTAQGGLGTIIVGSQDVLVENHLIVLKPQDCSVDTCRQLDRICSTPAVRRSGSMAGFVVAI